MPCDSVCESRGSLSESCCSSPRRVRLGGESGKSGTALCRTKVGILPHALAPDHLATPTCSAGTILKLGPKATAITMMPPPGLVTNVERRMASRWRLGGKSPCFYGMSAVQGAGETISIDDPGTNRSNDDHCGRGRRRNAGTWKRNRHRRWRDRAIGRAE